ncbi:hypothetical protein V7094_27885 [Priestia megaterium]|uniref:hypothetical protein n=1 Tax=Priestia megaterium TaxID=1404 RepID=UPI002FFFE073
MKYGFSLWIWFISFFGGSSMIWFSYGYDATKFFLFFIGIFTISIGSIFAGNVATNK